MSKIVPFIAIIGFYLYYCVSFILLAVAVKSKFLVSFVGIKTVKLSPADQQISISSHFMTTAKLVV